MHSTCSAKAHFKLLPVRVAVVCFLRCLRALYHRVIHSEIQVFPFLNLEIVSGDPGYSHLGKVDVKGGNIILNDHPLSQAHDLIPVLILVIQADGKPRLESHPLTFEPPFGEIPHHIIDQFREHPSRGIENHRGFSGNGLLIQQTIPIGVPCPALQPSY